MTIVGILRMADVAEKAAKTLANEHGVEAEVIDPRTLRPLDLDTILDSVRKTNRCVIVEEGWPHGGVGANIAALIQEQAFDHLDAPIQRVTGADVPMPYAKRLEQAAIPHAEHVVSAALATLGGSAARRGTEDIVMPRLSDSMEEGTILRWMKSPGDEVSLGEELVEIETDKANMVYEAPAGGTLIEILAAEGDTLPIGEVIARVGEAGESPSATATGAAGEREAASAARARRRRPRPCAAPAEAVEGAAARRPREPAPPSGDGRVKASPLARRIASEKGLDLGAISGSGPGGRIVKADVERASPRARAGGGSAPPRGSGRAAPRRPRGAASGRRRPRARSTHVELTKFQQTVARRMAESKATAPHFYLQAEIDMSRAVEARAKIKAAAAEGESCRRSTTWSSRPARSRFASTRGPTAPTATAGSSSTRGSTSASPSPPRTRWSCRPCSTPT